MAEISPFLRGVRAGRHRRKSRINSATAPEFPEPRTLHVPGEYPTFAAAIDAAALTGDTILVAPGIYQEALNFRGKRLRVQPVRVPL